MVAFIVIQAHFQVLVVVTICLGQFEELSSLDFKNSLYFLAKNLT